MTDWSQAASAGELTADQIREVTRWLLDETVVAEDKADFLGALHRRGETSAEVVTLADTVLVEIACRVQEPPVWLGSTYRAADGRLVRMVASHTAAGGLPRTIQWSYLCGSRGIVAATGAACDPPADASHF